ncbi:hypothetical protein B566_EDAN000838 [Ephemera danica]|nr:hypothetical protein B566_EDAN000838 [Ephemera danica]
MCKRQELPKKCGPTNDFPRLICSALGVDFNKVMAPSPATNNHTNLNDYEDSWDNSDRLNNSNDGNQNSSWPILEDFWFSNCTDVPTCFGNNCSLLSQNCTSKTSHDCGSTSDANCGDDGGNNLTEFHIIKAVVLVAVTSVLLLSVCRMVLQLFVRYTNVKQDK